MPKVLTLNNGSNETILSPRDFEYLIEQHMGFDSATHYHEQIRELSETIRDLAVYIDDKYILKDVEEVLKINGYE